MTAARTHMWTQETQKPKYGNTHKHTHLTWNTIVAWMPTDHLFPKGWTNGPDCQYTQLTHFYGPISLSCLQLQVFQFEQTPSIVLVAKHTYHLNTHEVNDKVLKMCNEAMKGEGALTHYM